MREATTTQLSSSYLHSQPRVMGSALMYSVTSPQQSSAQWPFLRHLSSKAATMQISIMMN
jgi:hypothetical protein